MHEAQEARSQVERLCMCLFATKRKSPSGKKQARRGRKITKVERKASESKIAAATAATSWQKLMAAGFGLQTVNWSTVDIAGFRLEPAGAC